MCYRDEKDFFDILRIIDLKLTNIEYATLKEFHIFSNLKVSDLNNFVEDIITVSNPHRIPAGIRLLSYW